MIEILVALLILLVILVVVNLIVDQLTLPSKVKYAVMLVIGVIFLLVLLNWLGLLPMNFGLRQPIAR